MENSIRETNIDRIRTRPRFTIETDIAPKVYEQILREHLKSDASIAGNINAEVAEFFVKTVEPSYYNPKLTMRIESEENKTIIRGIFGPSAAVWTFFMFLYFAFTVLWMVFITLWFVGKQIKSNEYEWALPASFGTLLLILGVYLAARYGQKKAKPQMDLLRGFALKSVEKI